MRRISVRLLLACTLGACGGSESDLDDTEARITEAAYVQACSEARDFLESQYSGDYFVQALCTAAAVEGNTDAESCGADLGRCINEPPPEIQAGIDAILDQAGCNVLNVNTATCSSTLGEIKRCLDEIDDQVSHLQYTLTCAAAGESLENWDLIEIPGACNFADDC